MSLLVLRITERCNLDCIYCYAHALDPQDMPWEYIEKSLDLFCKEKKSFKLQITGGEPLLNWEAIEKILRYKKQNKIPFKINIQTNGTLLTREMAQHLAENQVGIGLSIDSADEVNHKLRPSKEGKSSLLGALATIQMLSEMNVPTQINAVLTKHNIDRVDQLLDLCAYYPNLRGLSVDVVRPIGRGSPQLLPSKESVNQLLDRIQEKILLFLRLEIKIEFKDFSKMIYMVQTKTQKDIYCYAQSAESLAVRPNGEIYPCSSFGDNKDYSMGNIEEIQSLQQLEESKVRPQGNIESCKSCHIRGYCCSGCPAGRRDSQKNEIDCLIKTRAYQFAQQILNQ